MGGTDFGTVVVVVVTVVVVVGADAGAVVVTVVASVVVGDGPDGGALEPDGDATIVVVETPDGEVVAPAPPDTGPERRTDAPVLSPAPVVADSVEDGASTPGDDVAADAAAVAADCCSCDKAA